MSLRMRGPTTHQVRSERDVIEPHDGLRIGVDIEGTFTDVIGRRGDHPNQGMSKEEKRQWMDVNS